MKVSVIVPVYNTAPFVEESILSVQRQTLQDLEMILVDDGSTDNSKQIILRCMQNDNRIQYHYQDNSGAGTARNLGIEKARGEFIAFLDSDDLLYDADALERMVAACENNRAAVCASYRNEFKKGQILPADLFKYLGEIPPEGRRVSFLEHQDDFFFKVICIGGISSKSTAFVFLPTAGMKIPRFCCGCWIWQRISGCSL